MKSPRNWIQLLFLILFFLTPVLFTFSNSELFELPKMYFVYFLVVIIASLHFINFIRHQVPLFKRKFLNIPVIIFLISQLISTVISIDSHTSIFGYYSRLNGGLLSLISFILLFFILSVYLDPKFKKNIINFSLLSGLLVAAFGIAEHFGIDKNVWVQDVQSRVFSTLGQPNWLAAYLCVLLPLSISELLSSSRSLHKLYFFLITSAFYLTLLFTKSKSGIIAALISLLVYFGFIFIQSLKTKKNKNNLILLLPISVVIIFSSLLINNPIKEKIFPNKSDIKNTTLVINNLNITPSEDIRKIVWQGSIELWKKYPLFGTGTETFAYSYYWTRPVSHNLTSEWDFLYNKAHNEYLNYLATTGAFGLVTYLFLIIVVLLQLIKTKNFAMLSAYTSILITNIAGFSVVTTSLFFFLIPALIDKPINQSESNTINKPIKNSKLNLIAIILVGFCSLFLLQKTLFYYLADISYQQSESAESKEDYFESYKYINTSLYLRSNEPVYLSRASLLASKLAIIYFSNKDTEQSQNYINLAINYSNQAIKISPANTNLWKERAQMYYYLSTINSSHFQAAISALEQVTILAPTDAKAYFLIGQFLDSANLKTESLPFYQKAISLKSNYDHAYFALGKIYFDQKKYDLAKVNLENNLKYAPTNTDAKNLLKKIP